MRCHSNLGLYIMQDKYERKLQRLPVMRPSLLHNMARRCGKYRRNKMASTRGPDKSSCYESQASCDLCCFIISCDMGPIQWIEGWAALLYSRYHWIISLLLHTQISLNNCLTMKQNCLTVMRIRQELLGDSLQIGYFFPPSAIILSSVSSLPLPHFSRIPFSNTYTEEE